MAGNTYYGGEYILWRGIGGEYNGGASAGLRIQVVHYARTYARTTHARTHVQITWQLMADPVTLRTSRRTIDR
jgi:hypothetical protein